MFLVDSSVWINHFRRKDSALSSALESGLILTHPFIIGELALGSLHQRTLTLSLLDDLPSATVAEDQELRRMIESKQLHNRGIGFVDAHLLASTMLSGTTSLWTADRRLNEVALELGIAGRFNKIDRP